MYSVYGDLVLDPFLGTGTTTAAAIAACRNSLGVEICPDLGPAISETVSNAICEGAARVKTRVSDHGAFAQNRSESGCKFKHYNRIHHTPVMTSHEVDLTLYLPELLEKLSETRFVVTYRQADNLEKL